ncbi:MAG: aminotransferase class V-fold PLP-dependent enzyme [Clostridia bacterium]
MERPLYAMLESVSRRQSLHMPGGQGHAPFERIDPYLLDTTEIAATDDLYCPTGAIARAQALIAASAGAAFTLMLTGGSTAGVHTMLLYAARRGDEVILPRNAHLSCLQLCAIAGLVPVFAQPSYTKAGLPYTRLESYVSAMDEHPHAKAVLAVRPDYYGMLNDLHALATAVHAHGMLMLCDEAHGAALNWDEAASNAMRLGADMAVQSAHKTLPALGSGAWLHANERVEQERLLRTLRMVQTSSPSFVILLALDDARAWMDAQGARACAELRGELVHFHEKASALGYANAQDEQGMAYDPLRLVLYAPQGGERLSEALACIGVDVELCDERRIVCILSLMDGAERLRKLLSALEMVKADNKVTVTEPMPAPIPPRDMPLCEAAFAPCERVPLQRAVNRISAVQVGRYPPGIAWLTAGERVTPELVQLMLQTEASHLFGLNGDGSLNCIG